MSSGAGSLFQEFILAAEQGDEKGTLEIARRAYRAFLSGEISLEDPVIDPDVKWEPPPNAPTAGTYRGPREAHAEVDTWTEPWDDFSWEPKQVILGRDRFVVVGDMAGRGRASGIATEVEEFHVWTLRDRRVVRMQMFLDRGEALVAAGLSPDP
jgi:ketosteroid isomerase-like protein